MKLISVLQINVFHDFHSTPVWMLCLFLSHGANVHLCNLRPCTFQIRDVINNDKQANDLFRRASFSLQKRKKSVSTLVCPWNFVLCFQSNMAAKQCWNLRNLSKVFLNSLIGYEKQWFMSIKCIISINPLSFQRDVTFMQMCGVWSLYLLWNS